MGRRHLPNVLKCQMDNYCTIYRKCIDFDKE
jgi:hypothetical protein